MNSDFRTDPMPSPEGEGQAKAAAEKAWGAYYKVNKAVNKPLLALLPFLKSASKGYVSSRIFDLFGFWLVWQLFGGFENVQKQLGLSRTGMYRRIAMFREVFGEHPDVYKFPGVEIDPVKFVQGMQGKSQDKK